MKNSLSLFPLITIVFTFACSYSYKTIELNRAESSFENGQYKKALIHYLNILNEYKQSSISVVAAKKCIQISMSHLKDYKRADQCFSFLIDKEQDNKKRLQLQVEKSHMYFERLNFYERAIDEYQKALTMSKGQDFDFLEDVRFRLAQSYFQLKNYFQSEVEINKLLEKTMGEEKKVEVLFFLSQILVAKKSFDAAEKLYLELMKSYPRSKNKGEVQKSYIQVLEEKRELKKAVQFIDSILVGHPKRDWLELKKVRLEARLENEPGAHGLSR